MKRHVKEPTYKKFITDPLKRFDERNNAFSLGVAEGDKYTRMHEKSVKNIERKIPGKSILEHAMWVAARTVDYVLRAEKLARSGEPIYNKNFRLKYPDPGAMTKIVKEMAKWLGADLVGITKLNPLWLYTNWGKHSVMYCNAAKEDDPIFIPPEYDKVIVMACVMSYKDIQKTPSIEPATDIGYSRIAFLASSMATFIRELGYHAIPAGNELGLSIPMAIDAGLGELGRNGLLITPEFGSSVRICKVFTDLPLYFDSPIDFGVQRFCEKCGLCVNYCAAQALTSGPRIDTGWDKCNSPGILKWPIRAMKCFDWWVENGTHCSVCIRVCPFTRSNIFYHKLVKITSNWGILTKMLVSLHEFMGIGKQKKGRWFSNVQDPSIVRNKD